MPNPPRNSANKMRKPVRKAKRLPTIPEGLTVREKLIYVKVPLTAAMLAELLGVSAESVYKAARAHRLPALPRVGGLRFDGVEIAQRLFGPTTQKSGQSSRSGHWKTVERKSIMKVLCG
jgi:hypothetical protein